MPLEEPAALNAPDGLERASTMAHRGITRPTRAMANTMIPSTPTIAPTMVCPPHSTAGPNVADRLPPTADGGFPGQASDSARHSER